MRAVVLALCLSTASTAPCIFTQDYELADGYIDRTPVDSKEVCCELCAEEGTANCVFQNGKCKFGKSSARKQTAGAILCTQGGPSPTPTPSPVEAAHWAVLAATSRGYNNYRHQASVFHAYQMLREHGFPESNIIVMAYDDIAFHKENPFPGKIFSQPDPTGDGKDVYAGCKIDYKGPQGVTPASLFSILDGSGSGPVLRSTKDDNVFIYLVDHGAKGLIQFPEEELHKSDLQSTLQTMYSKGMFGKLVFYLETCYSGSMFEGLNIPSVYAASATDASHSSAGWYCSSKTQGGPTSVGGKEIGACLASLWGASWLEDSDSSDMRLETLQEQYEKSRSRVGRDGARLIDADIIGLPVQWGEVSFVTDTLSEFQGEAIDAASARKADVVVPHSAIPATQVDLDLAKYKYMTAKAGVDRLVAGSDLLAVLNDQLEAEAAYRRFLEILYPDDKDKQDAMAKGNIPANQKHCELSTHEAFKTHGKFDATSSFALQFHTYVVNVCGDVAASGANIDVVAAARQACASPVLL